MKLLKLCSVHLGEHLSEFGHILTIIVFFRAYLGQDIIHSTFTVLVIASKLREAHVDFRIHGHHANLLVRDGVTQLSHEQLGVLNSNLCQEVGKVLDGLLLLGFESLSLNLGIYLGKVLLVVILALGSNLSIVVARRGRAIARRV